MEAVLIVVRGDPVHYSRPYVWQSSQQVNDFFNLSKIGTVDDLALRMEGYMSAGVQGAHLHRHHFPMTH